jgi:hypothetical protein
MLSNRVESTQQRIIGPRHTGRRGTDYANVIESLTYFRLSMAVGKQEAGGTQYRFSAAPLGGCYVSPSSECLLRIIEVAW